MNPHRLYRSRRDRQLAGVAGGIAEYLEVDPTVVRVLWILSVLLGGFGILLYIVMAFVVPLEPVAPATGPWPGAGGTWAMPPGAPSSATGAAAPGDPGALGDAAAAGEPGDPAGAGARPAPSWQGPTWQGPAWQVPAPGPAARPGRGTLVLGVLLVVFGTIALANAMIPGWIGGAGLGAAFLVALGVALLVGATRRTADDR